MKYTTLLFCILACLAFLTSCTAEAASRPVSSVVTRDIDTALIRPTVSVDPLTTADFTDVTSVAPTSAADTVYMILGREHSLFVSRSPHSGKTFSIPLVIADDRSDRPAVRTLAIDSKGRVHLAWLDDLGTHLAMWEDAK
jgi:hypothetical protein